jgi:transposase, IS30 family
VATRTVLRHREGDLLKRARNDSTVGTLVERLAVLVFFADPYSPWQHGSNETTKGLLRPDLPKGADSSRYTQREVNAIAHGLNTRPRKCLNFATPLEVSAPLRHHSPAARGP